MAAAVDQYVSGAGTSRSRGPTRSSRTRPTAHGLRRGVHAHLFRHGYAINFLNGGGRLDALQEQLGHRDINTTRIYLRLTSEDVMREVAKIQF